MTELIVAYLTGALIGGLLTGACIWWWAGAYERELRRLRRE